MEQELTLAQVRDDIIVVAAVEAGGGALQTVEQAVFIVFGLQLADEPGTGIGEGLVVQVGGVLRDQHLPNAKSPRLFEHPQHDLLGRRVEDRGHIAEDFIEIEDGPQGGGAALGPHPGFDSTVEQGDEKHALFVAQVGDVEDAVARAAIGRVEQGTRYRVARLRSRFGSWARPEYC